MNAPPPSAWTETNQRYLVAEFARLKARLGEGDERQALDALEAARTALIEPAAIDTLAHIFSLSGFERDVLLLAAGVEMDSDLAALCGAAQNQPQRPYATFGLALGALAEPHWSASHTGAAAAPLAAHRSR